jgi:Lamin Tail Domain
MNRNVRPIVVLAVCISILGMGAFASSLVISEIAWGGTAENPNDEWIELRNIGDEAVDLLGWQLEFADTVIPLGEVGEDTLEIRTTALAPGAFLVLERTNDDSISDITADLIYKGLLSNAGILINLRNPQGEIVDSATGLESGWPAGSGGDGEPAFCTMERTSGGEWATNNAVVCNGTDAAGAPLNGTPGQMNSADVMAQWAPVVDIVFPAEAGAILSGIEWITWTASDPNGTDPGLSIAIYVAASEEEDWVLVIENLANMGSFSWDTGNHDSSNTVRLLVRAVDPEGYAGEAISVVFEISNAGD